MLDEAVQRAVGLGRRDGEQPRPVVADDQRQVHPVEVVAYLLVDVVFTRLIWLGTSSVACFFGGDSRFSSS